MYVKTYAKEFVGPHCPEQLTSTVGAVMSLRPSPKGCLDVALGGVTGALGCGGGNMGLKGKGK